MNLAQRLIRLFIFQQYCVWKYLRTRLGLTDKIALAARSKQDKNNGREATGSICIFEETTH